jgi:hypothetical protein
MRCPKCNIEMKIISNKLRFEGDKSPDTTTKAIRVVTLKCRNKQCSGHEEVVEHTAN